MSRFLLACSLVASLATSASADRAAEPPAPIQFAQPPDVRMPRRALDRDTVRTKLAAARAANLARFRAYQRGGVFPSNTYSDGALNVWRDEAGHLCAAATIIRASGQVALVDRVAEQDNFIKLGEVEQGPLMDWILTSGFTQAEVAAIQEPFRPVVTEPVDDPLLADLKLRRTEDRRLIHRYKQVEAQLVRHQRASLELAIDRLMAHPTLAWQLIDA